MVNLFTLLQNEFPSSTVSVQFISSTIPMKPILIFRVNIHDEQFSAKVESQWFESDEAILHTVKHLLNNEIETFLKNKFPLKVVVDGGEIDDKNI